MLFPILIKFGIMGEAKKKQELTSRQKEILSLLRKGLTNSEICFALNISTNTVKVHLANIYKILEVTNRTEAVSVTLDSQESQDSQQEVKLAFCHNDDFSDFPLAHTLFLSIVEELQGCSVFHIKICQIDEYNDDCDYLIKLATPQSEEESLFIALQQKNSDALLWSILQKIKSSEDIKQYTDQISIQLFRHIILSAAETYKSTPNATPQWWYTSCATIMKMENRNKAEFEDCEKKLQDIFSKGCHKDFISAALSTIYYAASTENWIDNEECTQKLGAIAMEIMRENPSSIYSLYSMALYSMFLGNEKIAIDYFESIIHVNSPLHIVCRRLLSQMYSIVGRNKDALKQLDLYNQLIPSPLHLPFQFVAKAFIYFMQGDYNSCKKVTEQILMFHPEIPYARLLLIASNFKDGILDDREMHIAKLFEYNPDFSKKHLERFIACFKPEQRILISSCLSDLFKSANQ